MLKKNLLSESIIRSWAAYQKQVRLSRRDKSTKNIHKLRVSTQKVEALLNLANSAKSSKGSKKIITQIKNIRKKLGPLRDSHVQSKIIENLSSQNQKKLRNFFDQQRKKAKEKAVRCLGRISLKEGKNKIKKITQKMIKFEFDKNQLKIKNNLNSEIKSNVLEFNKLIKNINPERIKEIHEFRKLAKKLRYQVEFTNSQKILKTYDLKKIKHIQSVTGKIQNDSALIDNLDQFLKAKKNNSKTKVLKIKKDIQNHQSKLIHQNLTELSALK